MRILFMCTANSCRSILSEALFNHLAPQGFEAVSSGSLPKGQVLPRSLSTLQQAGISIDGLYSKGNDAFEGHPPDIVISDYAFADGETGLDVVRALRARFGEKLPAILLTGNNDPQLKAAAATDAIVVHSKPVDFTILQRSIDKLANHDTKRRRALKA